MKLTRLTAAVIAVMTAVTPLSFNSSVLLAPSAVLAEGTAFDEETFFVYVGTSGQSIPQFRYIYPESDGSYTADKVLWEDAPTDLDYGDIYVADGDAPMTKVYPAEDDPANAHVYYYTLDDGAELNKAGNCSELMEKKDLSVTSKTYDGSSHWSVRYKDAADGSYYYGLSTYSSHLLVDPLDCEVGDIYTFAMYNDCTVVPLVKQTDTLTETMTVEIVEINGTTLIVNPTDPKSDEPIALETKYLDSDVTPYIGMKLEVTFANGILESYPEQFGIVKKVTVINEKNELLPGQVRVTLLDADTNEPIIYQNNSDTDFGYILFRERDIGDGYVENPAVSGLKSNPSIIQYADLSEDREYSFHIEQSGKLKNYSIIPEKSSIVRNKNNSYELVFKLKFTPTGDVNDDGEFSVADVVLLQKWLLAAPDVQLENWKAVDYCNDNKLNVFDLCLMKRELVKKTVTTCVEPDERFEFGIPFRVVYDGLKLYLGPDESYKAVAEIPENIRLIEKGVQKGNDNWLFTEYNGQYGWIRISGPDGKRVIYFEEAPKKPVIYLYPEEETDVHVELDLKEADLSSTYPKYNNGWDVVAYPDGSLLNKADNSHHRYLFWDAVNCRTRFDFSKGFCVAGCDTESFLKEKLSFMGLTEEEMNDFIVYWLPLMEHNKYNLISFQGDTYTNSAKMTITPTPDSECRIFMAYVPLENAVEIEPQQLETFERKGFSVVEWGGAEVRQ